MVLAIVLVLLVVGSLLFHFLSPWWLTPLASNWGSIDFTIDVTFWVTGVVFVAVNLFLAYAVVRYRYREGRRAEYAPENKKLEGWLTGLTAVGVAAMLAPGLFVWAKFVEVPEEASVVEAVAQQWHWSFRFPGEDGALGTVAARHINAENPFGINPHDPNGRDDVLIASPELHLPVNQPVRVLLRSKDVLHNFTVPQIRVKMDLVPGTVSYLWFTPTKIGRFDLLCEELCGLAHYAMRGKVVVEEEGAFRAWLNRYPTLAQSLETVGDASAGETLYARCVACHGAQGEGNRSLNAPKLSGQDAGYLKRQLKHFRQGIRGAHKQDPLGQQMTAVAATLTDETAVDVVAYIQTLPDSPAKATVHGDVAAGQRRYALCAVCHGAKGRGRPAMNAPRQAGINDWYLVRQLKNFKQGVRGGHPKDIYGAQMAAMAAVLTDESAINDLVAYINTLR